MYCNVEDVRRRLPEVTAHILRDSTIAFFIEEAQERIDARLRDIYDVPFTSVPTHISKLCSLYSAYLTLQDYPDQYVDDDLNRMWNDIDELLKSLATGKDNLGDSYKVTQPKSEPYFAIIRSKRYRKRDVFDNLDSENISNETADILLDTESKVYR